MSKITDHYNKHSHNEKVWNIMSITNMWPKDTEWANAIGKMAPIDLLNEGAPQSFNLWKYNMQEVQ